MDEFRYDEDKGLFVPKAKHFGIFTFEHFRKGEKIDEWQADNTATNEGLIWLLNLGFTATVANQNWYCGLFSNNYTPLATDTASSIVGNAGEFTGYTGGARPAFTPAAAAQPTPSLNNNNTKASFTFNASGTLIGSFIISSATPNSNTGILYAAAQFPSSKNVSNTDNILMSYALGLTP
jgi:hypothetical protein